MRLTAAAATLSNKDDFGRYLDVIMSRLKLECFDDKDENKNKNLFIVIYHKIKKGFCLKVLIDPGRT